MSRAGNSFDHDDWGAPAITYTYVENVAFADATQKANPSPWTRRMFMLYYCLFIATLNSCINGFDGSLMNAINSYKQYRVYFGFDPNEGTPATGIVYAIYTIGNLLGSFAAGPASDTWGRKWGMFIGAIIIMTGTAVQATSTSIGAFMGGRFILGFGVSISAAAGPAYASEMAHPAYRGVMTGVFNTFWFVGGIPGTFVPYGTSVLPGTMSWRIPVWLQMIFSGIVLVASPWLPETPRWLIANDRHEEALNVMSRYHGEGSRDSPIVQLEYREMVEDISVTGSDKRWWDYRELFNSHEVRYRSMLVIAVAFFGQWAGNGPVSYYYPMMLQGAGIKNNHTRLLLSGLQNCCQFAGAIFGVTITDRWGRRMQLLSVTFVLVFVFVALLTLNAINVIEKNGHPVEDKDGTPLVRDPRLCKAFIAVVFVFGFVYSVGWTPLQALYPVECLRYESRAKGMGMLNFFVNIANFYNTFVTGIAFSGAGWRYYFLFIFWDCFEFVMIYFFFVETKKRTLEELTEIFKAPKPVKASLSKTQVVLHGENGVEEVLEKVTTS